MKQAKKSELRMCRVVVVIENKAKTIAESVQEAREEVEKKGLIVYDVKPVRDTRTLTQNAALHLFFAQLADELNSRGLDMRAIIRDEVPISWTQTSVKENLWRPLQKALVGKKSTTQLFKTGEIGVIYDNLNRILTERTKGDLTLPPFPSIENMYEK